MSLYGYIASIIRYIQEIFNRGVLCSGSCLFTDKVAMSLPAEVRYRMARKGCQAQLLRRTVVVINSPL